MYFKLKMAFAVYSQNQKFEDIKRTGWPWPFIDFNRYIYIYINQEFCIKIEEAVQFLNYISKFKYPGRSDA